MRRGSARALPDVGTGKVRVAEVLDLQDRPSKRDEEARQGDESTGRSDHSALGAQCAVIGGHRSGVPCAQRLFEGIECREAPTDGLCFPGCCCNLGSCSCVALPNRAAVPRRSTSPDRVGVMLPDAAMVWATHKHTHTRGQWDLIGACTSVSCTLSRSSPFAATHALQSGA